MQDVERGLGETGAFPPARSQQTTNNSPTEKDPKLVTWDGPSDPLNPKNWTFRTKWTYTITVSIFTFMSPVSSSMIAPALSQVGRDLGMTSDTETELAMSIFLLAYAFGPLFFGPVSEIYGRLRPLQLSNLWYLAWNLGCGFAKTPGQLFAFRFLAGLGGSAPLALGGGAMSDVWAAEERGRAMGIYALAPVLGPAVGPIAGGFIAEYTTWRWVFWSSSAFAVVVQLGGLMGLRESYAPVILKAKRDRMAKEQGIEGLYVAADQGGLNEKVLGALIRPVKLITTQVIVACIAVYLGYLFGTIYLLLGTFPAVWTGTYGESLGIGGLNYISLAIGSVAGIAANFFLIDRIYGALKRRNSGVGLPEFRIPTMLTGSTLIAVGLFWYGWSVEAHLHWVMPNIGIIIFGAGTISCLQGMQAYIVDTYTRFAASGVAACSILRSLGGFGFPLFAPYMYKSLGYGWGTSVLAFLSLAIGTPSLVAFWYFGARLRAKSKYAAG